MIIEENIVDKYLEEGVYLDFKDVIETTHNIVREYIKSIEASSGEKERWLILNDKYRDAFFSNKRTHLFRTCTGSGKTVTSVMWVKILTKLYAMIDGFVVLSYEYKHGTDEIERIILKHGNKVNYIRFEGKNRLCSKLKTIINVEKNITIGDLMKYGISIKSYCENDCDEFEQCIYVNNCRKAIAPLEEGGIKNLISVHHQLGCFIPIYLHHVSNIMLIIDENFTDGIKISKKYTVPKLKKNLDFLNMVKTILKRKHLKNDNLLITLVNEFIIIVEEFLANIYDIGKPLNYEKIDESISIIDSIVSGSKSYMEKLNGYAYGLVTRGKINPFKFIFDDLIRFIKNYEYERSRTIESEELYIDKEKIKTHFIDWREQAFYKKQDKYLITFLFYDKLLLEKLINTDTIDKIIINDATADINILDHLFGGLEPITEHNEDWLYRKTLIYQLKKKVNNRKDRNYAHYPKSSFLHQKTFNFLMDDVKVILMRHINERVLIVAREIDGKKLPFIGYISLSEYLNSLGHPDIVFEEYPLAGTNIYSDVNVIIILGKPDLPNFVTKRQSALLDMDQESYRNSYSKNMITQAIGRILRGDKQKYIYILTGFDMGFKQKIITFKSHSDLKIYFDNERKESETKKKESEISNKISDFINKVGFITINQCSKLLNLSIYKTTNILNSYVKNKLLVVKKVVKNASVFYLP